MRAIDRMSNNEIMYALIDDGYLANVDARSVTVQDGREFPLIEFCQILRQSAANGCLLWTREHIVSTYRTCPFSLKPLK